MKKFKNFEDVVCPFCGTLCDDLKIILEDNKIIEVDNACAIGTAKFFSSNVSEHRYTKPMMRNNDKLEKVTWDEALNKAAELLANAKRPLSYGWSSTECDAQRKAVELMEICGGVLDNTASVCHGPSILAIQDVGCPTSTLGEYKNRADLVLFWGSNPVHAHPRHMSRYSDFIRGYFRIDGHLDRTIIVVDPRTTHTAQMADMHIRLNPGEDYELFNAIRAMCRGIELDVKEVAGVPIKQIKELVEILKSCKFGVLFFGLGLTMSKGKHRNVDAGISLIRELNEHTKFNLTPMRGHYNVSGANIVFTWSTGYPYSIDFSKDYPRYNPGEFSAVDILKRNDFDVTLIVASDPASNFPKDAVINMLKKPLISVEPHKTPTSEMADIILPPAIAGIECEGTAYRMDKVPIRLRKVKNAPEDCMADYEIIEKLIEKVKELKGE